MGRTQFVEEHDSPEDPEQAVRIPQRKSDAEADVSDGVNGQRVGDCPHASGEYRPNDQMRGLTNIGAHVRSAADESGHAPSCEKDAAHHDQGNGDRRDVRIDQLNGGFGAAQPCSGGESAEDA